MAARRRRCTDDLRWNCHVREKLLLQEAITSSIYDVVCYDAVQLVPENLENSYIQNKVQGTKLAG